MVDAIIVDFFGINQNQLTCTHSLEVPTAGIDKEFLAVIAHRGAEVIGNGFVIIQPCRPTKCGRQFTTSLFHLTHDPPITATSNAETTPVRLGNLGRADRCGSRLRATSQPVKTMHHHHKQPSR